MALQQNEVQWFRALWLRVAIAVGLAIWFVLELVWSQDMFWATMVGVVLAYFIYQYLYRFPKNDAVNTAAKPTDDEGPRP